MLRQAGLVTGGTAGLALTLHYASGWPLGLIFFGLNLPFYWLAWQRKGPRFTLKTFLVISLLSIFSEALGTGLVLAYLHPLLGAVAGGLLMGVALLILFRHQASAGGVSILVLWLQETRGWRAGQVQMGIDAGILLLAAPWVSWDRLLLSIFGAAALNFCLAVNHKPGRYQAA